MATDNTNDTTDGQLTDPVSGIPLGSLGAAECRLAFDEDTYQRVRDRYERAVEHGYSDGFDTFAFNHCAIEWSVTVDGKPVAEPRVDSAE